MGNAGGIEARVTDYGGVILSLAVPDRSGRPGDVVLGFDRLEPYQDGSPYFGAIIGRYANRIAEGRFMLDGRSYTLARNESGHHLHGGERGFDKVVWSAAPFRSAEGEGLALVYHSPDGEEGYPGTLVARVGYTLSDANELIIDYRAASNRATPVNLTQHTYFNLRGHAAGDVLGHVLRLGASRFTPVDATLIPTGEIRAVGGTPFDFTRPTAIGARIEQEDAQLRAGDGYDHNFVLEGSAGPDALGFAAEVLEPVSGRRLEVFTTEPGLQFYSGNALDGSLLGKDQVRYQRRAGFTLETQHFPDSPNQPRFPSTILRPGEEYRSRTVYRFSVLP